MNKKRNAESGQAIVLIMLLMIPMIASLGLALDGGGMFFLHRDAQNAADAAAWSAAYAYCTGGDYQAVGLDLASRNGFTTGERGGNYVTHSVTVTADVEIAPNDYERGEAYITVEITAEKDAYFIQIVDNVVKVTPLMATTRAVSHCTPQRIRPALLALSTTCQDPMRISGSNIEVLGTIVSNGDLNIATSTASVNGDGYYLGTDQSSASVNWYPYADNPFVLDQPMSDRENFSISDYAPGGDQAVSAEGESLYHYSEGSLQINTNPEAVVLEGLYFAEGNIDLIGDNYSIGLNGVTFVARGSISISANNITLMPYAGELLLFSDLETSCGANAITMSSALAAWEGLVYAPHGGVNWSDSDGSATDGGIVAQTINIHASNTHISRIPEYWAPVINLAE